MRLIDNKEDISYDKVTDMIYWKEYNILYSNNHIRYKQSIDIRRLINSDYLIGRIYNEINR